MDLVHGPLPPGHPVFGAELAGHGEGAVQGDPAHDLGVEEIPRRTADLPDALVLLGPAPGRGVGHGDEELLGRGVQLADLLAQPVDGSQQLAVHVDLALGPGPVADAHRSAVPPPCQVGELTLGQISLGADPEHDLQVGAAAQRAGRRHAQVGEELLRLVGAGGHPHRVHGEGRITDPREAVVPVAVPSLGLRQRRGGGGHDRAGRVVGEGLEDPATDVHELVPRPVVGLVEVGPRPPTRDGVGQPLAQLALGPQTRGSLAERAVVEPEREAVAG